MSYHHPLGTLGASFDPLAALQQATTAAQQAADIAKRTSDAATQVQNIFAPPAPAPVPAAPAAPRPTALISAARLQQFRPALVSRLSPVAPSAPANTRILSQQSVDAPKDDDKEKSNTALYVALGLAAVAAVFLLKKKD